MPSDHHPRYVTTQDRLWILDRWYCHLEVYRAPHGEIAETRGWWVPKGEEERTAARCAELNAEHDAWLRAG